MLRQTLQSLGEFIVRLMSSYCTRTWAPISVTGCEKKSVTKTLRRVRAGAVAGREEVINRLPTLPGQQQTRYDVSKEKNFGKYWYSAYEFTQETPEGYWVDNIEGQIPLDLHGTYFRNGPGDFNFLDEPVVFPLDANGIVGSVAIKDGRAFFRSRFVKTRESIIEEMAGRRLFRGNFGTIPKHGVPPIFAITARTAGGGMTFLGKDKLYVSDEGSELTELDPFTLETVWPKLTALPSLGNIDWLKEVFSGPSKVLKTREVAGFGDNRYDGCRNVTVCHGYQIRHSLQGGMHLCTKINFYEIDEDLKLYAKQRYVLDNVSTVHSIGITENYYIVNKYPMHYDLRGLFDLNAGLINSIRWDPSGSHELHLVPRPSHNEQNTTVRRRPRVYKMERPSFLFHFINAYEEDGNVVVDGIHYPEYPDYWYGKDDGGSFKDRKIDSNPSQFKILCSNFYGAETHEISTRRVELPNVNPSVLGQRYRYAYLVVGLHPSATQNGALGKVKLESGEMEVWTKGLHYSVGEPLFVPRPNSVAEDDGRLMTFCYNGKTKKSEFVILDAKSISKGPVATLYLNHAIGHGFHGTWTSKYFGPRP